MRLNRFLPWALITTFVILLLFFGAGVTAYSERSSAEVWKAHTYRVLLETGATRVALAEAQTNLRGFLLTRDKKFSTRFEQYNGELKRSLEATLHLVDSNREQARRIARIQSLHVTWESAARRRIAQLQRSAGSTPGLSDVQRRQEFARGAAIADQIRALLDSIDRQERLILEQRIASATRLQSRTEKIVFGGSVFGLLAMGVLAVLLLINARELAQTGRRLENENAQRRRAESEIRAVNESLAAQLTHTEQRNREIELLSECGQILQACQRLDEVCTVITQMLPRIFPATGGVVYLLNASENFLDRIISWTPTGAEDNGIERDSTGEADAAPAFPEHLQPDECWALRCGQKHRFERDVPSVACPHLQQPLPAVSLCIPLLAQGNVLGLLNLYDRKNVSLDESDRPLVLACAEQIGLAISNLQLRETLRYQSIRDPLTNLYNRRYLEESLEHELLRAKRSRQSVGVIMMDIDFFKRFNDAHGHGAGDALLQAVAKCLQTGTRGSDIACRYGGEELTLILPEATYAQTVARAEKLRQAVERTQIHYHGSLLGPVTLSAGVACFPEDAGTVEELLRAADAALYQAKAAGRNRVVASTPQHGSTPVGMALASRER
jgi:diguanylate cyclase (GGDEF)-like protein